MSKLLLIVFPTRGKMLDAMDYIRSFDEMAIHSTALIARAEDGETTVYEDDISPNEGAIAGGTLGSLMGAMGMAGLGALLLPGVGAVLALGAGGLIGGLLGGSIGAVTGRAVDLGIENERLDQLARDLENNQAALVVEVEISDEAHQAFVEGLKPYDAKITTL